MARPTPASSSDRPTGRAGEPVASRRAPTSADGPGVVRVAAVVEGVVREAEGDEAIRSLPKWLRQPNASV
jgi:hypothetical protein